MSDPTATTEPVAPARDPVRPRNAPTGPPPILTVEDLMERWGVSRVIVLQHVDNPDHPLPYLPLSGPLRKKGKNRSLLRFRLAAVEAWEAGIEVRASRPADAPAPPSTVGKPATYGGKVYTRATLGAAAKK